MSSVGSVLWNSLKVFQIYGANTNVGKTIVSSALCHVLTRKQDPVHYVKPVSTGDLADADVAHVSEFSSATIDCLYQFRDPVSPHIAAGTAHQGGPTDSEILSKLRAKLSDYAKSSSESWAFVETAGGVLSPAPSKSLQADLYRPLRLPVVLVADSTLGGISTTLSSYEALKIRGYDVEAVVTFRDDYYQNHTFFEEYFADKVRNVTVLSAPPKVCENRSEDHASLKQYYESVRSSSQLDMLVESLQRSHYERMSSLNSMAERGEQDIWFPFSQHSTISKRTITAIDSAYGDFFQTVNGERSLENKSILAPSFDGSASWWTQGLGHGNPQLALAAAYAAGRYGHVILAGSVHEPALALADELKRSVGNYRIQRVFYSDNGSTAIEVSIKMAMKATCDRYGWDVGDKNLKCLGLKRSYHGDTIGSMDCSEPSIYNDKISWYRGNGFWFEYPTVILRQGKWVVEVPEPLQAHLGKGSEHDDLCEVFDLGSRDATKYERYILDTISSLVQQGDKFGAVIMEPILLGAGGMVAIDPLFQKALIDVVRDNSDLFCANNYKSQYENDWTGLPIIFDEVFTGLYRLGCASPAHLLDTMPDISVHAKLLTGGLVPLSATLASEPIFKTFLSESKADALLHGHSYTAHPVGCNVARESIKELTKMDHNGSWDGFKKEWNMEAAPVWSMWTPQFLHDISYLPQVDGVFAMGSVLAITLKDDTGSGYASNATVMLQSQFTEHQLNKHGVEWNIHSRGLGNVLYFMAGQKTPSEVIASLQDRVMGHLRNM